MTAYWPQLATCFSASSPGLNVVTAPARRDYLQALRFYDGLIQRRLTRALEVPRPQRDTDVQGVVDVSVLLGRAKAAGYPSSLSAEIERAVDEADGNLRRLDAKEWEAQRQTAAQRIAEHCSR